MSTAARSSFTAVAEARAAVLVGLLALVVPACKRDGQPGSCYRDRDSACVEYDAARAAAGQRMCAGHRWTPGVGTCPTENRLGTCVRERGAVVEHLYAGPPNHFTPVSARGACESGGGSWSGTQDDVHAK